MESARAYGPVTRVLDVRPGEAEVLEPFRAKEIVDESQMPDIDLQDLMVLLDVG
ncbi:hypothetical protein STEG23_023058, partial [Scotinomys teguina]